MFRGGRLGGEGARRYERVALPQGSEHTCRANSHSPSLAWALMRAVYTMDGRFQMLSACTGARADGGGGGAQTRGGGMMGLGGGGGAVQCCAVCVVCGCRSGDVCGGGGGGGSVLCHAVCGIGVSAAPLGATMPLARHAPPPPV